MDKNILNNEFINLYTSNNIIIKTKNIQQRTKCANQKKIQNDILFWYIYKLKYPEHIIKNVFLEEKKNKFKIIVAIHNDKKLSKKFKTVDPYFTTINNINLEAADAMCTLFNISIIITYENTYVYLNKNTDNITTIIEYDITNYKISSNNYHYISSNFFYVENYKKLLYSHSRYKVDELKDISIRIGIHFDSKTKKSMIYDNIINKLKLIYLKI